MIYSEIRGLKISKLTLGTVQLGLEYGVANKSGKPDINRSFQILDAAVDGGVNSFDTAEAYGDSEEILGKYFSREECKLKQPAICTKFWIRRSEGISQKDAENQIYEHIHNSLKRLGLKKIPVFMVHDPVDLFDFDSAILNAFKRIKTEGLVDALGISIDSCEDTADQLEKVLKYDFFDAVQIPLNIMDQRMIKSGTIKKLQKANMIVYVRSVFLQGLFHMKPEELTGNLIEAKEPLKQLYRLAESEGVSVAQLAFTYIRDMEGMTSLVIGAETPEQVNENNKLIESPGISERARNEVPKLFNDLPLLVLFPRLWKK